MILHLKYRKFCPIWRPLDSTAGHIHASMPTLVLGPMVLARCALVKNLVPSLYPRQRKFSGTATVWQHLFLLVWKIDKSLGLAFLTLVNIHAAAGCRKRSDGAGDEIEDHSRAKRERSSRSNKHCFTCNCRLELAVREIGRCKCGMFNELCSSVSAYWLSLRNFLGDNVVSCTSSFGEFFLYGWPHFWWKF